MNTAKITVGLAGIIGLGLLGGVATVLLFPASSAPGGGSVSTEIRFTAGEIGEKFGFGLEGQSISSPGPTTKVKVGEDVRVRLINRGASFHSFAVVAEKKEKSPALFGAAIASASRPLPPNGDGSVVFKADKSGSYFYICTVPGHVLLGMYGEFVVEGN